MNKEVFKMGLTLIELLIVIFVISLLSTILFLSTKENDAKAEVNRAVLNLAQDLRETEEKAMGAEAVDCGGFQIRNFGVNFQRIGDGWQAKYIIFGDCDKNNQYDDSIDILMKEVGLSQNVVICSITAGAIPVGSWFNIVFQPPEPIIFLNNHSSGGQAELRFCSLVEPSYLKAVLINNAGKIEVD